MSASQYPVQLSLSSLGTTSGTELTIIPDGSIPLGQSQADANARSGWEAVVEVAITAQCAFGF